MKFEQLNTEEQINRMYIITTIQLLNEKLYYSEAFESLKNLDNDQLETKRDNLLGEYNILIRQGYDFAD